MLVTSMNFTLAPETRRKAEDALLREAIRAWQQRAASAVQALGYASWRPGRVTVSTSDTLPVPRQEMAFRAGAVQSAPVAVEGGTSEITVTVNGDAVPDKLTR
jgi:predicted secreted protein